MILLSVALGRSFFRIRSISLPFFLLFWFSSTLPPNNVLPVLSFAFSTITCRHCQERQQVATAASTRRSSSRLATPQESSDTTTSSLPGAYRQQQQAENSQEDCSTTPTSSSRNDKGSSSNISPLLQLASAHCTSQALHTFVKLGIADMLWESRRSLEDIARLIGPTTDTNALMRSLRLLTTVEILVEEAEPADDDYAAIFFSLTETGRLLANRNNNASNGMAACIQHWMEQPLWDAGLELSSYIRGEGDGETTTGNQPPFDRVNGGISSDYYYNAQDHPQSLEYANEFVKFIHSEEIKAIVQLDYWKTLTTKQGNDSERITVVDLGGHHGQVMRAMGTLYPELDLYSLDLPQVIDSFHKNRASSLQREENGIDVGGEVKLIAGNIFDPSTIPQCDILFMKHFLDRCMWTEEETLQILQTCRGAAKTVLVAEAVLPDVGKIHQPSVELSMDALYMLVGREGQRTESEWRALAKQAGLSVDAIVKTNVPSCSIIIMQRQDEEEEEA